MFFSQVFLGDNGANIAWQDKSFAPLNTPFWGLELVGEITLLAVLAKFVLHSIEKQFPNRLLLFGG